MRFLQPSSQNLHGGTPRSPFGYLGNLDFNQGRITCPLTTVRGAADATVSLAAMSEWGRNTLAITRHDEFGNSMCGDHFYYNHPLIRDSLLSLLRKICMMPAPSHPYEYCPHDDERRVREYSFTDSCPSLSISSMDSGQRMYFY